MKLLKTGLLKKYINEATRWIKTRRSSLFYNTSARHERHECDTSETRVRHEWTTSDRSATQMSLEWHECETSATRVQHKWDTSATRMSHEWHECDMSATRKKNFDFDNDTNENIFSYPYISYIANERLQGEEQFHSKNYLLEMPRSHAKMRLKSEPQKLNFVMTKAISKSYTLACSCKRSRIVTHSNTTSLSIKTTLCETNNILFSKNYWKLGKMNTRFWKNM